MCVLWSSVIFLAAALASSLPPELESGPEISTESASSLPPGTPFFTPIEGTTNASSSQSYVTSPFTKEQDSQKSHDNSRNTDQPSTPDKPRTLLNNLEQSSTPSFTTIADRTQPITSGTLKFDNIASTPRDVSTDGGSKTTTTNSAGRRLTASSDNSETSTIKPYRWPCFIASAPPNASDANEKEPRLSTSGRVEGTSEATTTKQAFPNDFRAGQVVAQKPPGNHTKQDEQRVGQETTRNPARNSARRAEQKPAKRGNSAHGGGIPRDQGRNVPRNDAGKADAPIRSSESGNYFAFSYPHQYPYLPWDMVPQFGSFNHYNGPEDWMFTPFYRFVSRLMPQYSSEH